MKQLEANGVHLKPIGEIRNLGIEEEKCEAPLSDEAKIIAALEKAGYEKDSGSGASTNHATLYVNASGFKASSSNYVVVEVTDRVRVIVDSSRHSPFEGSRNPLP